MHENNKALSAFSAEIRVPFRLFRMSSPHFKYCIRHPRHPGHGTDVVDAQHLCAPLDPECHRGGSSFGPESGVRDAEGRADETLPGRSEENRPAENAELAEAIEQRKVVSDGFAEPDAGVDQYLHLQVRQRERRMQRFKSPGSAQLFLSVYSSIYNHFNYQRHLISRNTLRQFRDVATSEWCDIVKAA